MDFLEMAKKRYSVRKYLPTPVEEEKLLKILEAARVAPTAGNRQPQVLLVIRGEEGLARLRKGANVYGAPLAIMVCGDHDSVWKRRYDGKDHVDVDTTIVTDHIMHQATELGLGTIWVCGFDPAVIKPEFNIPDHIEPVNILGVGYAAPDAAPTERHLSRKPLSETVKYESFQA